MRKIKNKYKKRYKNQYSRNIIEILTADSIMSDVMLGKNYLGLGYKTKTYKSQDRKSDNYLVYCTSCKKIWENHYKYNPTVYHENVPTYGKSRIKCRKCKEKNNVTR